MTAVPMTSVLLLVCLWMIDVSQQCILNGHWAYCSSQSLQQVPPLPPEITHLDLSLNRISQLSEDSFKGLENLVHLDLGWQRLTGLRIRNNTFKGLHNLTFLHLGSNRNIQIELDAFQGLPNLQTLNLLHCDLGDRILSDSFLKPLVSLQSLDLFGNKIKHLRPAMFFKNMRGLRVLNLTLNQINSICETDVVAFRGKHFDYLNLASVQLAEMNQRAFNWTRCGNPLQNMSFDTLDLSLTGLSTRKAQLLFTSIQGAEIHHLILRSNIMGSGFGMRNILDPDNLTFQPLRLSGIKSIDLSKNYIRSVKSSVFRDLTHLESITMANNNINSIEASAFVGLSHLHRLNLPHNYLGEIHPFTFMHLPNLKELDLSNNHIGVVHHGAFSGLTNLLFLNLGGNSLNSLWNLAPLPSLQTLLLDDNRITTVNGLKRMSTSLTSISLDKNRLTDLADIYKVIASCPKLSSISLADNSISLCTATMPVPSHNRLQEMNLENNALHLIWGKGQCLDLFDNLGELSLLSLRSCSLKAIPEGLFKGLSSLQILDLSHNSLTRLSLGVFPTSLGTLDLSDNFLSGPDPGLFQSLDAVNLRNNRFLCDCDFRAFLDWAKGTNVTLHTPLSQLYCEFPKKLLGVAISEFTTENMCSQCLYKCSCS